MLIQKITILINIDIFFCCLESKASPVGGGRLTERLLAQGLLTPNMLQELKKEWSTTSIKEPNDPNDDEPKKIRRKRKITKLK